MERTKTVEHVYSLFTRYNILSEFATEVDNTASRRDFVCFIAVYTRRSDFRSTKAEVPTDNLFIPEINQTP